MAINASFGSPSEMEAWEGLRDYGRPRGQYSDLAKQAELVGMDYESYAAMSPEEQQRLLDQRLGDPYELAGIEVTGDRAETPDFVFDYLNKSTEYEFPDAPETPSFGGGNNMIGSPDAADPDPLNVSNTEETEEGETEEEDDEAIDIDYEPKPGGKIYGQRGPYMPRGPGMVRLGPNASFPIGPLLAGGAAVSLNDDGDGIVVPPINNPPPERETKEPEPPDPEEPQPNMATRLIPSTQTGALPELSPFIEAYAPAATDIVGDMAGVSGAGFDAFARSQLGMTGPGQINQIDVGRELARQQTGALAEASGAGEGASYQEMIDAFASPFRGVSQMRGALSDIETLRQQEMERLDQGLSGRQKRDAIEFGRAKSGTRAGDRLGDYEEIFSLVGADEGLRGQRMQNFLGLGELTSDMATREAYALSPFTGAAVQAADITPGLRLAGDISRQASAATPSPMELFGLEAGERQFGLDQEALEIAEKTGNYNLVAGMLNFLQPRGGANVGLGQQGPATVQIGGYGGPIDFINQYRSQFSA